MKMNETFVQYVKASVDVLVAETDFPVSAKALIESGVATRQQLRKLERMGVLKCMLVDAGRGHLKTYYTEDALPKYVREERRETDHEDIRHEEPNASEGHDQEDDQSGVQETSRKEGDGYDEARKLYEELYGESYDQADPNASEGRT